MSFHVSLIIKNTKFTFAFNVKTYIVIYLFNYMNLI